MEKESEAGVMDRCDVCGVRVRLLRTSAGDAPLSMCAGALKSGVEHEYPGTCDADDC